jgi:hypothetical protein
MTRRARPLSPWESLRWFDTPTVSNFTGDGSTSLVIAPFNGRRVVLILSTATSGGLFVAPVLPLGAGQSGFNLTPNYPLILTQQEHGALVQQTWFMQIGIAASVNVIEVALRDWPEGWELEDES